MCLLVPLCQWKRTLTKRQPPTCGGTWRQTPMPRSQSAPSRPPPPPPTRWWACNPWNALEWRAGEHWLFVRNHFVCVYVGGVLREPQHLRVVKFIAAGIVLFLCIVCVAANLLPTLCEYQKRVSVEGDWFPALPHPHPTPHICCLPHAPTHSAVCCACFPPTADRHMDAAPGETAPGYHRGPVAGDSCHGRRGDDVPVRVR